MTFDTERGAPRNRGPSSHFHTIPSPGGCGQPRPVLQDRQPLSNPHGDLVMAAGEHSVVIVGGGPTGLMLAGELALAGVDVAVVERRNNQDITGTRAGGL